MRYAGDLPMNPQSEVNIALFPFISMSHMLSYVTSADYVHFTGVW